MEYLHQVQKCPHQSQFKSKQPKSNITKEEREALHNLKKGRNCMVLTADEVVLVVMDKETYIEKCMTLLSDPQGISGVQGP